MFSASGLLAGVTGSPHDFSRSSLIPTYQSTPLTSSGVCSICHIPHNAAYGALWPRNLTSYDNALKMVPGSGNTPSDLPNYRRSVTVQCYDCHDYHAPAGGGVTPIDTVPAYNSFAMDHKPQNIAFGFTKPLAGKDSNSTMKEDPPGGTEAGYYENSPPFDNTPQIYYGADSRTISPFYRNVADEATLAKTGGHYFKSVNPTSGSVYKGDKLPCSDCHDPHAWDSTNKDWQAFFRPPKLYGTGRWAAVFGSSHPIASDIMANPVLSGDRNNQESRKLCILCHATSGTDNSNRVSFNDINSTYSSTQKIVPLPSTVGDHAGTATTACVSCHSHNSINASCTQCHGFPPAPYPSDRRATLPMVFPLPSFTYGSRDPHPRHYGKDDNGVTASIYAYGCTVCHATSALGSRSGTNVHGNDNLNIAYDFSSLGGGTIPRPPDTVSTAGKLTCSNVYCHSNGGSDNTAAVTGGYYTPIQWGQTTPVPLLCNACHGSGKGGLTKTPDNAIESGMPNYPGGGAGSATANSHAAHVAGSGYNCKVCHNETVQGTWPNVSIRTSPLRHVNGIREVVFDNASWGYNQDNNNQLNNKRCDVACHGTGKPLGQRPQWGGILSCDGCHQSQGAGKQSYTYSGVHQTHTDNTGAVSLYNFACEACHAAKASARLNTAHVSGDNSATPRYVEVLFTDNASLQAYDNTGAFRSFDMWTARYSVTPNPSPSYVDNGVLGGTDALNSGITWSTGSCTNVWCHTNANPAVAGGGNNLYRVPAWATPATPRCTLCHLGPDGYDNMVASVTTPANGGMSHGHQLHVATDRYRFACDECHADTAAADSANAIFAPGGYAKHVDGTKDVKGGTGVRLSPINDNALQYAGGTCSSTYCHSAGVDNDATGGFDNSVASPAWGSGATHCTSCHGGSLASGKPMSTGKHLQHLQEGYRCSYCHALTIASNSDNVIKTTPDGNGLTGYQYHVNGVKNYVAGDNYSFTPGSCRDISCHGGTGSVAAWPVTEPPIGCTSCHLHNAADNDFYLSGTDNLYTAQHPPNIDNTEWVHSGHGKASGNYDVSNFPPANFPGGVGGSGDQCNYCHDDTVTHNTAGNPFRLKNQTGVSGYAGAGWNATCLVCHSKAPVPPGYDPDGSGTNYIRLGLSGRTGGSFVDNSHYGTEHAPGRNGGKFCWDCHDPHGDRKSGGPGNIYMVQKGQLARQTDNTYGIRGSAGALTTNAPVFTGIASGTNYADNTTYQGICQVCHTQGTTGHYRFNFGDGHNATTRCTQCHKHDTGFSPSDCKGCHGGPGGDNQVGAAGAPLITRYWKTSGHGSDNATAKLGRQIECEDCHDLNIQSGEGTHAADNSTGTAPNNINTEAWPNKTPANSNTNPNVNTSHLVPAYIGSGSDSSKAQTFDDACYTLCHAGKSLTDHRHTRGAVMEFGKHKSTANPKQYLWYSQSTYSSDFYRSWSPWVVQDTTTTLYLPPYSPYYGMCVSCHDPHGTGTTDVTRSTWRGTHRTNHMVRGNWISNGDVFCNTACHTTRTPP